MRLMAEDLRIEHTFDCSEDAFWGKLFFDEEYNRRMYYDALNFPLWREISSDDRGDELIRIIECEPNLGDLPGAIKKVIGDNLRYREEGHYDKASRRYRLKIIPSRLADKMGVEGELFTESAGDGKCKRIFTAKINVKIFGVGTMIEKRLVSDLRRSYDVGAGFTVDYIREKGI